MRIQTTFTYRLFSVCLSIILALTFTVSANAQSTLDLPSPGMMVSTSPVYNPAMIKGITIHPENSLQFDFIVDMGDDIYEDSLLKEESVKLIKYFLTALTVSEEKMWVNLSPYEKDRIIPDGFRETAMGRDLLAQDYILKQLMASMMYPEEEVGKVFWERVYQKVYEKFGAAEIPMNAFNKIWIIPDTATVHVYGQSAIVVDHHLKVMLDEDYLALKHNTGHTHHGLGNVEKQDLILMSEVSSEIIREVLIPEIEQEVNTGKNFSQLRQIFNSVILATWYKKNIQESFLGKAYVDQNKTVGLEVEDRDVYQRIYDQYVEAFKIGVYDYIKEDYSEQMQEVIPRKYFSGGIQTAVNVDVEIKNKSLGIPDILQGTKILPTMLEVPQESFLEEEDENIEDAFSEGAGDEALLVQASGQQGIHEAFREKLAAAIMAYKNGDNDWPQRFAEINEQNHALPASAGGVILFSAQKNNRILIQKLKKGEDYRIELEDVRDIGLVIYLTSDEEQIGVVINLDEIKERDKMGKIPAFSFKGKTREEVYKSLKKEVFKKELAAAIMAYKNGDNDWPQRFAGINEQKHELPASAGGVILFSAQTNNRISIQHLMKGKNYRIELADVEDIGLVIHLTNDEDQVGVVIDLDEIKERETRETISVFFSEGKTREEIYKSLKLEVFKRELVAAIMAYKNGDNDWPQRFAEINEHNKELPTLSGGRISFTIEKNHQLSINGFEKNKDYRVELEYVKEVGLVIYFTCGNDQVGAGIDLEYIKERKSQGRVSYFSFRGTTREEIRQLLKKEAFKKTLAAAIMAYKNGDNDWQHRFVEINGQNQPLTAVAVGSISFGVQKNNVVAIQNLKGNKDYQVELKDVQDIGLVIYLTNREEKVGVVINLDEIEVREKSKAISFFTARGRADEEAVINRDLSFKKRGWKLVRARERDWQPPQFVIDNLESAEQSSDKVVVGNEVKELLAKAYTDDQINLILQVTELIYDDMAVEDIFQELGLDKDARAWFEDQWNNHLPKLLNGFRDEESAPGGIDLNPRNLDLTVQGDDVDFHFVEDQDFDIIGLIPVIGDVLPISQINLFGESW